MSKKRKNNNNVPFNKLSKKEQRRINAEQRGNWGEVNPVTRCSEVKKSNVKGGKVLSDED